MVNKEVGSFIKFFRFHDTLSSSKQVLVLSVLLSRTELIKATYRYWNKYGQRIPINANNF